MTTKESAKAAEACSSKVETLMHNGECNQKTLQDVLRKFIKDDSFEVVNVVSEPACPKHNNFVSIASRIVVNGTVNKNGKKENYDRTYFVKAVSNDQEHNELMNAETAFKNEMVTYENIIPFLNKYMSGGPIKCPEYIYGDATGILLEDLKSSGFEPIAKVTNFSDENLDSIIQEVARFHAASLVAQYKVPEEFKNVISPLKEILFREKRLMEKKQQNALDTVLAVMQHQKLPDVKINKIESIMEDLKKNIWDKGTAMVKREAEIKVITHSDIWVNNVMEKKPNKDIILFDWQNVRFTSPAVELSYFMHIGINPHMRMDHYKTYLTTYLEHLKKYSKDQVPEAVYSKLTLEWLENEMKETEFFGFMMAAWIMPIFYYSDEELDKLHPSKGFDLVSREERMKLLKKEEVEHIIALTNLFIFGHV